MATQEPAALMPQAYLQPSLSLRQLWAILWAYRRWIVLATLAAAVLAGVVSKLVPKVYSATATVLVDFEVNDPLSGREFPSDLAASYMATQLELLGSPTTLLPVVDRLKLTADKRYTAGYGGGEGGLREYAMSRLYATLDIGQAQTSRILYISAEAGDPQLAARVANTVAQVYIERQAERALGPARERAERYAAELETLQRKVDEAQAQVTQFRERTGLIDPEQRAGLETERLAELDRRLIEAQSRSREAQLRLRRAGESDAAVLDSGLVQSLKGQLAEKEALLADKSQRLGRRHPDLLALQADIASLRAGLWREVGVYGGGAYAERQASRQIEQDLQREVQAQRAKVLETRRLQDEGARYLRELEAASRVYDKALEGYDQILLGSRSRYSNASVVSQALPPVRASRPKARVNALLGLFAGAFFGIAGSLIWELLHRRLRSREDVERDLGLPVLAQLKAANAGNPG